MEGERKPNDKTCKGGCGFFGSAATNGLCSLCYKKQLTKMNAALQQTPPLEDPAAAAPAMASTSTSPPPLAPPPPVPVKDVGTPSASGGGVTADILQPEVGAGNSEGTSDAEDRENGSPAKKSKPNRCVTCRKKVGLLGFECRCGGVFCGIHRYSDKHDCSFDYREHGKNEIQKNNPVVVAEKIKKI